MLINKDKKKTKFVMVDTLAPRLTVNETGKHFNLDAMGKLLTEVKTITKQDSQKYITGKLANLRVFISELSIYIDGSCPVYLYGDNFHQITRAGIQDYITSISDHLHQDMMLAKVSRVDIGANLITKHSPSSYFPYLQGCNSLKRHSIDSSLYYSNKSKILALYDKIIEALAKGWIVPEVYENRNVMRFECRWMKRAASQLKEPCLTLAGLTDERVYIKLIDRWANEYKNINKQGSLINFDKMNINTAKDLEKHLAAMQAQSLGYETMMGLLQTVKPKNGKTIPRLKIKIDELLCLPGQDESFEMTEELGKQIEQIRIHYR